MRVALMLALMPLILVLLVGPSMAEESRAHGESLTLYIHDMRPYHYKEQGQWRGVNLVLVKRALEMENIAYQLQTLNWARASRLVQQGDHAGLLSVERTLERENRFQWVGPLVSSPTVLIGLKNRDLVLDNMEHLSSLTVGVLREGATHQFLRQQGLSDGVQLVPLVNINDTYQMLSRGRVDLIPGSVLTLRSNALQAGVNPAILKPYFTLPQQNGKNYLALSPNAPVDWVRTLNQRLAEMRQKGVYDQLVQEQVTP